MKSACDYIYEAMASVYNLSIEQGVVPSILKTSEVLPVDKGGDITDPSIVTAALFQTYRPLRQTQRFTLNGGVPTRQTRRGIEPRPYKLKKKRDKQIDKKDSKDNRAKIKQA